MQKGQGVIFFIVGILVTSIIVIGGAFYIRRFPAPKSPAISQSVNIPSPTVVTASPTPLDSSVFKNPNELAYVPDKGFAPDAERLLVLATLQISLEKYHLAKGVYPSTLDDLFPTFAPKVNGNLLTSPPLDPVTHQPYIYQQKAGGQDYQLTAILESEKQYSVTKASLPR